ncbi:MAG: hypothetical protein ACKO0Z_24970 [Betaproteobacteria bacterium]
MTFTLNDNVKIKFTLMTGAVKGAAVDPVTLTVQYLVEYVDNDGVGQARYFVSDDLEAA